MIDEATSHGIVMTVLDLLAHSIRSATVVVVTPTLPQRPPAVASTERQTIECGSAQDLPGCPALEAPYGLSQAQPCRGIHHEMNMFRHKDPPEDPNIKLRTKVS
jgi:hypothetical protein